MKKTYNPPTMKVRKIQCSHMLCGSQLNVHLEDNPDKLEDWDVEKFSW